MKALLYIFLLAGAVYATTTVVPENVKERAFATVGLSDFSTTETIENTANKAKETFTDNLIPKSPQERRAERIERLKQSLTEIREAQQQYEENPTPQTEAAVKEAVNETAQTLQELEEENEKEEEGAVSSVLHATADGIRKVTGTESPLKCEPIE